MNEVFKALADPTRREILRELRQGEKSAGDLAECFPLAKSTLSGHFAVLKAANLIHSRKAGTSIFYRLNSSIFEEAMTHLLDFFKLGEKDHEKSP
ncbi:MAG: autorepressor SdpR family transcription factor [Deinococcales bacterium]